MAKYKGKDLSLTFGTEEINLEATSVTMDNEEADDDDLTFAEIAEGSTGQWFFEITAISDYGAGSFWAFCWDNVGSLVDFLFKPYGNATASTSQPHFRGKATVAKRPPVGGEANATFKFEIRLDIEGVPERVTA